MNDTRSHFLNRFDIQFILELLQKEQQRLDTLKSQVKCSGKSWLYLSFNLFSSFYSKSINSSIDLYSSSKTE